MKRVLIISEDPIDEAATIRERNMSDGMGAALTFSGVVRAAEGDDIIAGIDYESFGEMAEHQFDLIFDDLKKRWSIESVKVIHRIGRVAVNEPSLFVEIISPHRGESFEACQFLINEMKEKVTIWKRPYNTER